jgi:uncharacterized protein YcfJ
LRQRLGTRGEHRRNTARPSIAVIPWRRTVKSRERTMVFVRLLRAHTRRHPLQSTLMLATVSITIQTAERPTGVGAIGGAVVGGLFDHQIGGGRGRILATVAGAPGGGLAGTSKVPCARQPPTTFRSAWKMAAIV